MTKRDRKTPRDSACAPSCTRAGTRLFFVHDPLLTTLARGHSHACMYTITIVYCRALQSTQHKCLCPPHSIAEALAHTESQRFPARPLHVCAHPSSAYDRWVGVPVCATRGSLRARVRACARVFACTCAGNGGAIGQGSPPASEREYASRLTPSAGSPLDAALTPATAVGLGRRLSQ
jgi:hypothetical protein